jgi:hypothetical protein
MKVIRNFFMGKTVVFIDDNIVFDGIRFTRETLEDFFDIFYISKEKFQELINNYTGEKSSDDEVRKYATDPDPDVRHAIALCGKALDILVNDEDWLVRKEVAEQCYGLYKLVNDKDPMVRQTVAKKGYCLDILVNDPDYIVSSVAQRKLNVNVC